MKTSPARPFGRALAVVVLGSAVLAIAGRSDASNYRVAGVRATINRGTLTVQGGDEGDAVTLRLEPGDPDRVQVDVSDDGVGDFSFARSDVSAINVKMGDGDDSVRVSDVNGAFTNAIPTTISGGDGDDALDGGLGAETFRGGDGDERVDGGGGSDIAVLGDGNDLFVWDPGDGSDVIDGQGGTDTMLFNGSAAAERFTMTANGRRLSFFRNVGLITMDTAGVETVDLNALGGADEITVNDLTGTDVTQTTLDLAGALGGAAGDGVIDKVVLNGTDGDDTISVGGSASGVDVTGLATRVSIERPDTADGLFIETLNGTDDVSVSGVDGVMDVKVDGQPV